MKIADELLILTKEHHLALSLANHCKNTFKRNNIDEISALCTTISTKFAQEFKPHFNTEEQTLLKFLSTCSNELKQLCAQLISEHQQLYQLAKDLVNEPQLLPEFASLLAAHARLEDRQVFPNISLLSETQKQQVLEASRQHPQAQKLW